MDLSPKQRFLRWAFPHADNRLFTGDITKNDHELLSRLITSGGEPSEQLLKRCFPNAVFIQEIAAKKLGVDLWSHEAVTERWYRYRMCDPDRMMGAQHALVLKNDHSEFVIVEANGQPYCTINLYRLRVDPGDHVHLSGSHLHGSVLVEKSYIIPRSDEGYVSTSL